MGTRARQSGYALAAISLLGLAAMGSAAMFITEGGVNEASAVEDDLLRVRANWAMNGHMTYVLSRARQDGFCEGKCDEADTTRAAMIQTYADEANNANPAGEKKNNGNQRRWSYPELHPEYAIDTDILGTDTGTLVDGRIVMTPRLRPSSIRLLQVDEVLNRIPAVEATLCAGLGNPDDNCPAALTNDNLSGMARIVDFRVVR